MQARANFVVFEVLSDRPDARCIRSANTATCSCTRTALKLQERRCIYDNLLIPTALCIPV